MRIHRSLLLLLLMTLINGLSMAQVQVAFFLSPSCMICRYYAIEMRELHTLYSAQGIEFTGYAVGPILTDSAVVAFRDEYKIPFSVMRDDAKHRVLNATITPEVFVIQNDSILYHGRIDDNFIRVGKRRAHVKNRELRNALECVLQGQKPEVSYVPAVGCIIEK